jgi:hypothetical protein
MMNVAAVKVADGTGSALDISGTTTLVDLKLPLVVKLLQLCPLLCSQLAPQQRSKTVTVMGPQVALHCSPWAMAHRPPWAAARKFMTWD